MSFRRLPKEIDPRRPPKRRERSERESEARSYGQYIEATPEELAELERTTGEVAREAGDSSEEEDTVARAKQREVDERERFERATGEVSREDGNAGC